MTIGATVGLILLCFVFEGFFSGSEIALVSANRMKLQGTPSRADAALPWPSRCSKGPPSPWAPA